MIHAFEGTGRLEAHRGPLLRWILVLLLLTLMALFTGAKLFYMITGLCLGVMSVNGIILWINAHRLVSTFHISASVLTAGETLTIQYRLLNNSMVPIYHLSVKPVISKELGEVEFDFRHYAFKPYEILEIERQLQCDRRGFYAAGEMVMKLSDPLGILTYTITRLKPIEVAVYPRVYPCRRFQPEAVELYGARRSRQQHREDQTSVKSVRKYLEGDSARRIHWALTAKTTELQVKEYANASTRKIYLFVDGYDAKRDLSRSGIRTGTEDHWILFDGLAEIAASLANMLLKDGAETVMLINDRRRTECHGRQYRHLSLFMDRLTAFIPNGPLTLSDFLNRESRRFQEGAELFIVCGPLEPSLMESLRSLIKRRFTVTCFSLDPDKNVGFNAPPELSRDRLSQSSLKIHILPEANTLTRL